MGKSNDSMSPVNTFTFDSPLFAAVAIMYSLCELLLLMEVTLELGYFLATKRVTLFTNKIQSLSWSFPRKLPSPSAP